jgi:predicted TIM-barrel fold metal-dependent hydrolase
MIIDVHTHLFPPKIRQQRESYFKNEPAFESLYRSPRSKLVGAADLIEVMNAHAVERSVIFGFPWQRADTFKRHNDYIMEAVDRYPDRLIGLGCFDAAHEKAADEARRCLAANLSGIGELAFYQAGLDEAAQSRLAPIMQLCREQNAPVMIHTNEPVGHRYPGKSPNTLGQIYALVKRFSDNTIILAHWGGGLFFFGLLKKEVKDSLANVFFDTAASPYLYEPAVYRVAEQCVGLEKILFGSDYPLLPPSRYFDDMQSGGLTPEQIADVCGRNAQRLFGLMPANG